MTSNPNWRAWLLTVFKVAYWPLSGRHFVGFNSDIERALNLTNCLDHALRLSAQSRQFVRYYTISTLQKVQPLNNLHRSLGKKRLVLPSAETSIFVVFSEKAKSTVKFDPCPQFEGMPYASKHRFIVSPTALSLPLSLHLAWMQDRSTNTTVARVAREVASSQHFKVKGHGIFCAFQ